MTAPEQPDLHQRIAQAISLTRWQAVTDLDGRTVAVDASTATLAGAVLAVVEAELTKRQERGDIWKAKAAALEQDRDRLDTELAALREQLATVQAENARLRAMAQAARDFATELADECDRHGACGRRCPARRLTDRLDDADEAAAPSA